MAQLLRVLAALPEALSSASMMGSSPLPITSALGVLVSAPASKGICLYVVHINTDRHMHTRT